MFLCRLTVYPEIPAQPTGGGGFLPTSFGEWLQSRVQCPGLDPAFWHVLVAVTVAADRNSAELTIHSEPKAPLYLDRHLRPVTGTPEARVRVLDETGIELFAGCHHAPLQPGQQVRIGADDYQVLTVDWPHRNEYGMCVGELDWQHATVTPVPQVPMVPSLDPEQPEPDAAPVDGPRPIR
jgi:hypothetical protein